VFDSEKQSQPILIFETKIRAQTRGGLLFGLFGLFGVLRGGGGKLGHFQGDLQSFTVLWDIMRCFGLILGLFGSAIVL
jgi:hypothetical protein